MQTHVLAGVPTKAMVRPAKARNGCIQLTAVVRCACRIRAMPQCEPVTTEPRRLGDFEIVREIGRGGMGVVYEARQLSLKRRVALKVLSGRLGLSPQAVQRFQREAEAAAKLHHTNIVPIYATGKDGGTHFYAMELIEGPSLNLVIREMRRATPPSAQPGIATAARDSASPTSLGPTPSATTRSPLPRFLRGLGAWRRGPAGARSTDHVPSALLPVVSAAAEIQTQGTDELPSWVMQTMTGTLTGAPSPATATGANAPSPIPVDPPVSVATMSDSATTLRSGGAHFDTVARMIAEVGDALDYAHRAGVIHRDIKPANLLLSPAGRLSINDFGLARVLEEPGMTTTGELMGTPLYMSPEQIAAGRAPLDHRTDIYSLGAALYELLTLQPPFPGERRDQIIAQILHRDPTSPRRLNRKVPVDLETICLKALERDPDRRYPSAGQMAEDLRRYVNRYAISAKRAGPIAHLVKWTRRRPAVAALLSAVLVLAAGAGVLVYAVHRSNVRMRDTQRQNAIDAALLAAMSADFDSAETHVREAEAYGVSQGWVTMLRGNMAYHRGRMDEAVAHLEQAVQINPNSVAARGMLARAYMLNSQVTLGSAQLDRLSELQPRTAEDYLFKGMAESSVDPRRALDTLSEAIRVRDSLLARLTRGFARSECALMTADPQDVELAMEDAAVAKSMLPNSIMSLDLHLFTHLVGANIYEEREDYSRKAKCVVEAGKDARALGRFVGSTMAHTPRAWYFEYVGDHDAALVEWQRRSEATSNWTMYARALCLRGAFQEALNAIEMTPARNRDVQYYLHHAVIALELPDGPTQALADYDHLMAAHPDGVEALLPQMILYLLGRGAEAMAAAQAAAEPFGRMPLWMYDWYRHLRGYASGSINADELLSAAGNWRGHQCEAHFWVALRLLAEGDRVGAAEQFRSTVATRVFGYLEHMYSRLFLSRLDRDPMWPSWIPLKDNAATLPASLPEAGGGEPEKAP